MQYYADLVEAIKDLKARGYTLDFNLEKDRIVCNDENVDCHPHEFEVDEYHRFEGMSSTDDNSIIYAIATDDGQKGILISSYGVYEDGTMDSLIQKLTIKNHGK
ncbi:MAG: phosphoribosylpyrophosphate synthetase [Bacteroidota bacterium]